jgi:hypothetical protein
MSCHQLVCCHRIRSDRSGVSRDVSDPPAVVRPHRRFSTHRTDHQPDIGQRQSLPTTKVIPGPCACPILPLFCSMVRGVIDPFRSCGQMRCLRSSAVRCRVGGGWASLSCPSLERRNFGCERPETAQDRCTRYAGGSEMSAGVNVPREASLPQIPRSGRREATHLATLAVALVASGVRDPGRPFRSERHSGRKLTSAARSRHRTSRHACERECRGAVTGKSHTEPNTSVLHAATDVS